MQRPLRRLRDVASLQLRLVAPALPSPLRVHGTYVDLECMLFSFLAALPMLWMCLVCLTHTANLHHHHHQYTGGGALPSALAHQQRTFTQLQPQARAHEAPLPRPQPPPPPAVLVVLCGSTAAAALLALVVVLRLHAARPLQRHELAPQRLALARRRVEVAPLAQAAAGALHLELPLRHPRLPAALLRLATRCGTTLRKIHAPKALNPFDTVFCFVCCPFRLQLDPSLARWCSSEMQRLTGNSDIVRAAGVGVHVVGVGVTCSLTCLSASVCRTCCNSVPHWTRQPLCEPTCVTTW